MKILNTAGKCVSFLTGITSVLSYIGYIGIVLITVADVFMRYVFNDPILGAYEIVQYLLFIAIFASLAYTQTLHGHINVSMFLRLMPKTLVFVIYTLTGILTTVTWIYVGQAAGQQAAYAAAKGYVSEVLKFPQAPVIWVECVCMYIFALAALMDTVRSAVAVFNKDYQEKLMGDWF